MSSKAKGFRGQQGSIFGNQELCRQRHFWNATMCCSHPSSPVSRSHPTGQCERVACREATQSELQAVHAPDLVRLLHYTSCIAPSHGVDPHSLLGPDMYINDHTFLCARLAAGSAAEAAARVARGDAQHSAAIIRPPGALWGSNSDWIFSATGG